MPGSSKLLIHFINISISIDFNGKTVSCLRLLVLWGEGEGDKIVHMGKGKSWSVAVKPSVTPFMILTTWLERRGAVRLRPRGLAVPLTGFFPRQRQRASSLPSQPGAALRSVQKSMN